MTNAFISYSRRSEKVVKTLVDDFEALGYTVWFDQELSGGQAWWTQILERIRACDLFVFALDSDSLDSTACQREFGYAAALGKSVLPILVSGDVSMNLVPPILAEIQFVDYRVQDRQTALRLAKAVARVPAAALLPDPLPPPPEAPTSYLGSLAARVETAGTLNFEQQSALLIDLRRHVRDPRSADDARKLLDRLRKRHDLFATIADEISELHSSVEKTPRETDIDPTREVTNVGVTDAAVRDVMPRLAELAPVSVPKEGIPSRDERLRSAVVGAMIGTVVGTLAMTNSRVIESGQAELLLLGLLTGVGAAIAGAIAGTRRRPIVGALIGGLIGSFLPVIPVSFAAKVVFAAPVGAVLGATLGAGVPKRTA